MTYSHLGLTACTPGSAPGPTLGIEYGKPLPLPFLTYIHTYLKAGWKKGTRRDALAQGRNHVLKVGGLIPQYRTKYG